MLRLATATILLICLGTGARAQSIEEKAEVCGACHGENGIPLEKDIPIIWGQHAGYAYLQLRDFNKGVRHSPRMSPIAEALSKDDMTALAEYLRRSNGRSYRRTRRRQPMPRRQIGSMLRSAAPDVISISIRATARSRASAIRAMTIS